MLRVLKVLVLRVLKVLAVRRVRPTVSAAVVVCVALGVWIRCAPVAPELLAGVDTPSTVVVDRHGHVLYEALSADGGRGAPIDAASIPPMLEAATLAAEDRRFYSHVGIDPVSLVRAGGRNLVERQGGGGGGGITPRGR